MSDPVASDEPAVRDNPRQRRFEIWSDGELAGFSMYEPIAGVRAIVHTEIDESFAGLGLGSILVRSVLSQMREAGTDVLPLCPFVLRYVQRHPEFLDLVPAEERVRFGLPEEVAPEQS